MSAYRLGDLPGIGWQTGDEETSINTDAPLELLRLLNHESWRCVSARSMSVFIPAIARLNAPGIDLTTVGVTDCHGYGLGCLCLQKQADIVVERALVALERQNVIGSLVPYLFGNAALATHRINHEHVPCDISLVHYIKV